MNSELTLYDNMRVAIRQCAAVDEAAGIRDTATRLQAYAKIRDDSESQRRFGEIRLRACQRIGEISRDMEKGAGRPSKEILPTDGKNYSKADQLADVGISTSTAQRYEELTGPKEEQAEKVIEAATDTYFAKQQEIGEPVTYGGLRKTVRTALESTFGKKPKTRRGTEKHEVDLLVHFLYSARWAYNKRNFEPETLAGEVMEEFAEEDVEAAQLLEGLLSDFVQHVKERFPNVFESTRHIPA